MHSSSVSISFKLLLLPFLHNAITLELFKNLYLTATFFIALGHGFIFICSYLLIAL